MRSLQIFWPTCNNCFEASANVDTVRIVLFCFWTWSLNVYCLFCVPPLFFLLNGDLLCLGLLFQSVSIRNCPIIGHLLFDYQNLIITQSLLLLSNYYLAVPYRNNRPVYQQTISWKKRAAKKEKERVNSLGTTIKGSLKWTAKKDS